MDDLILFPFGGNAKEALMAIEAQNAVAPAWNIVGFVDDNEEHWGKSFCDIPVLGGRNYFTRFPQARVLAVPGNPRHFRVRKQLISSLGLSPGRFATVLDPLVRIGPDASIGHNTLVMANVFLSVSTRIGNHCVVLPNTVISHEAQIGDYTLIGSNVSISGNCSIGRNCYIGSGTRIRDGVAVGKQSLIGLGSNVIKDVAGGVVCAGNPARILRRVDPDECNAAAS